MSIRLWFYGIALGAIVGLLSLVVLPIPSNCGGNSAALSYCQRYVYAVLAVAADNPGSPFVITNISPEVREYFEKNIAHRNHWIPQAHFLVSALPLIGADLPVPMDRKNRRILIVCDRPYTKLSQHLIWHASPTHAVGYSDGTRGLISANEFAALDFSTFQRLDRLFPERPR